MEVIYEGIQYYRDGMYINARLNEKVERVKYPPSPVIVALFPLVLSDRIKRVSNVDFEEFVSCFKFAIEIYEYADIPDELRKKWELDEDHDCSLRDLDAVLSPTEDTAEKIRDDCRRFINMCYDCQIDVVHLFKNEMSIEAVAADFYLTRNGHGTGFFDREHETKYYKILDFIASSFNEVNTFVCEDGEHYEVFSE